MDKNKEKNKVQVMYLCDRKQCPNCTYPTCKHTSDITHAKNFKRCDDYEGTKTFWEQEVKKKKPYVKLLPCICGHNRRQRWSNGFGYWLKCSKCHRKGYMAPNMSAMNKAWNDMITDEKEMNDGKFRN